MASRSALHLSRSSVAISRPLCCVIREASDVKHAPAATDFLRSLFIFLSTFPASCDSYITGGSGAKPSNSDTEGLVALRIPGGGRSGLIHGGITGTASAIGLPGAVSHLYGIATGEPLGDHTCKILGLMTETTGPAVILAFLVSTTASLGIDESALTGTAAQEHRHWWHAKRAPAAQAPQTFPPVNANDNLISGHAQEATGHALFSLSQCPLGDSLNLSDRILFNIRAECLMQSFYLALLHA